MGSFLFSVSEISDNINTYRVRCVLVLVVKVVLLMEVLRKKVGLRPSKGILLRLRRSFKEGVSDGIEVFGISKG